MSQSGMTLDNAAGFVGKEIGISDWVEIDQNTVTTFAELSRDDDWMHVDVERAAREAPYGGTIVQGFYMVSLLTGLFGQTNSAYEDAAYGLNYGFDRLRFTSAVPVGSRVRGRFSLNDLTVRPDGGQFLRIDAVLEVEGQEKPALVAEWLLLYYPVQDHQ